MATASSFQAEWRIAENDAVPYADDFPEWPTMLVEPLNGNKEAKNVWMKATLRDGRFDFDYKDDGKGCTQDEANERLLTWASRTSVNGDSMYGHGTKKFLAKSGPYESLKFFIRTRHREHPENYEYVDVYTGPFKGLKTKKTTERVQDFPKTGFQIELRDLDRKKLGRFNTAKDLIVMFEEIIRSRKSQSILSKITYHLTVEDETEGGAPLTAVSTRWHSFFNTIKSHEGVKTVVHETREFVPGKVALTFVSLEVPGEKKDPGFHKALKEEFPVYGNFAGGKAARIHCYNDGTMIEAVPFSRFYNRATHSSMYNTVEFAFFQSIGADGHTFLPPPATTKVQYRYEHDLWKQFQRMVLELKEVKKNSASAAAATPVDVRSEGRGGAGVGQRLVQPEPMRVSLFKSVFLNDRKAALEADDYTEFEAFEIPNWMKLSNEFLVYRNRGGAYTLETVKERQRGSLKEDIHKAYTVLQTFLNEKNADPRTTTLKLMFELKKEKDIADRLREFEEVRATMRDDIYPLKSRIVFTPLREVA